MRRRHLIDIAHDPADHCPSSRITVCGSPVNEMSQGQIVHPIRDKVCRLPLTYFSSESSLSVHRKGSGRQLWVVPSGLSPLERGALVRGS